MRPIVLVLIATLALANRAADACRGCKPPTEAQLVSEAVAIYAGKVAGVDKAKNQVTVDVEVVWKGPAAKQLVVTTSCWFAHKVGKPLIVLDRAGKPSQWVSECLNVMPDSAAARARIDKLAGASKKP